MKFLKIIGTALVIIIGAIFLFTTLKSEMLPEGTSEKEADELAEKMLLAVNDEAWHQTGALSWGFKDHTFIWDKKRHFVEVKFQDSEILLDINNRKGVIVNGAGDLSEKKQSELCETAWKYWVNDSFWLNPVTKCKDGGTIRKLITFDDGTEGLEVSYSSGGSTPGDTYVWLLDENNRPKSWRLWVSIIPVKGMEFSWDDWVQLSTGAWVSTMHHGALDIPIYNPEGYTDLLKLTGGDDTFEPLQKATISF